MNPQTTQLPFSVRPTSHSKISLRTAALAGLFCLSSAGATFAAFLPLPPGTSEIPGIALGAGTAGATGTVIAAKDTPFFLSNDFQGTLRSLVVDTGSGYDFYYQIVNASVEEGLGTEFFRMKTLSGFTAATVSVTYLTDLTGLNFAGFSSGPAGGLGAYGAGIKTVFSADSDEGSTGSVGFDYSPSAFLFDPANIQGGETSRFAVVRTNLSVFGNNFVDISGSGTARVASYAAVPEPQTAALIGLGAALLARRPAKRLSARKGD
jgi:hypothetical protein